MRFSTISTTLVQQNTNNFLSMLKFMF